MIYTLDQSYGEKLLELACSHKEKEVNYYFFHELEALEDFTFQNPITYLIQGSEVSVKERENIRGERRFLLTENASEEGEELEVPIHKYQRGDEILKKIFQEQVVKKEGLVLEEEKIGEGLREEKIEEGEGLESYSVSFEKITSYPSADHTKGLRNEIKRRRESVIRESSNQRYKEFDEFGKGDRQGKVIGVYSPIHRIGKTKFALELGKEIARQESVLYMNLEPFAKGGYFHETEEGDLSNLLYFGSQESQNLGLCISVMVEQMENLDYIKPMDFIEDLFRVEGKMWKGGITRILKESIYTTIILDISDGIKDLFGLLEFCDTVYTLYIDEPIAMDKLKQYTDNLIKTGYDSVLEHTIQKKVELV